MMEPVPAAAAAILPPTGPLSGIGTCATTPHPPFVLSPRPALQYRPRITSSAQSASRAIVVRAACWLRPRRRAGRRVGGGLVEGHLPLITSCAPGTPDPSPLCSEATNIPERATARGFQGARELASVPRSLARRCSAAKRDSGPSAFQLDQSSL